MSLRKINQERYLEDWEVLQQIGECLNTDRTVGNTKDFINVILSNEI